jgi:hypothetical protein
MPTESASTTSSTVDTKLAELDRLITLAVQAQQIADTLREMAEAKAREIDRPLPLFDRLEGGR